MHKRSNHERTQAHKSQTRTWIVVPTLLAAVTAGCGTLLAQHEPTSSSRGDKAPSPSQAFIVKMASKDQNPASNLNSKDLKEGETKYQQQREKALREFMISRGFADKGVQNAIIAHLQKQEQARREFLQGGQRLLPLLHGDAQSAEEKKQMQAAVGAYAKALDAYREQRLKAELALDQKIKHSQHPQLQVLLLLLGAVGEGPAILPL